MEPIRVLRSRTAVLPATNIDTDQIIPARFLTTTTRDGLGKHLFSEWRYDAAGTPRGEFALNRPEAQGCQILVAGRNFGCGSSREHAPWALLDYGIRAVISTEIADIFRNNALKNGLVAIVVGAEEHRWLLDNPGVDLSIDVRQQTITLPSGNTFRFELEPFARHCLLEGVDQMGFLLQHAGAITAFEQQREAA